MIELDGRTGEGGGQLVRMACALAAVVTQPIRITNVRGNRGGARGGGLKAQHVSAIEWLAKATNADTIGLAIGSHTLEFRPRCKPSALQSRQFNITADSPAASTMLIFQAIFPFLLFASDDQSPHPIYLEILGGTNVSFSLSYEYLDQVLLPTLEEAFGIRVERQLKSRGWSLGKSHHGNVTLKIYPLPLGQPLRLLNQQQLLHNSQTHSTAVETIDISIVAPTTMHSSLSDALTQDLDDLFPNVPINFKLTEESGSDARIYILLVALGGGSGGQDPSQQSSSSSSSQQPRRRWGRDILTSTPRKPPKKNKKNGGSGATTLSQDISRKVCKELYEEVSSGGVADEYLQDQLVIFQALAEGVSAFPSGSHDTEQGEGVGVVKTLRTKMEKLTVDDDRNDDGQVSEGGESSKAEQVNLHKDNRKKTRAPFGEGSTHTTTARWVTTELLPGVGWYNDGRVCQGVGVRMEEETEE